MDSTNAGRWRPLVCHEIFHLWNGTAISSGEHQQYWFSEGATEYYAHLLPVRLGEVSGARFLETVSGKWAAYLEAAGQVGLLAAGEEKFLNHRLVYDGGALAALCLDLQIRAATSNRKSLDDVMKALYKKTSGRKGVDLTIELVAETVSRVAGRPMDEFFKRFIMGHEELPLGESLDLAGIELQADVTQLPDTRAVLGQLLLLPSVAAIPGGLHVLVSESELIRVGDLIVEVSGARIETFDDLRWPFRDLQPASMVSLGVIREGQRLNLDVVLAGTQGDNVPMSRRTRVTVVPRPDAKPAALAIRRSILGAELP